MAVNLHHFLFAAPYRSEFINSFILKAEANAAEKIRSECRRWRQRINARRRTVYREEKTCVRFCTAATLISLLVLSVRCQFVLCFTSSSLNLFFSLLFSSFVCFRLLSMLVIRLFGQWAAAAFASLEFDEHLAFYNGLYDQPWARLSPYFFGICMGYILHKTKEKLDINIVIVTCGECSSISHLFSLYFTIYFFESFLVVDSAKVDRLTI